MGCDTFGIPLKVWFNHVPTVLSLQCTSIHLLRSASYNFDFSHRGAKRQAPAAISSLPGWLRKGIYPRKFAKSSKLGACFSMPSAVILEASSLMCAGSLAWLKWVHSLALHSLLRRRMHWHVIHIAVLCRRTQARACECGARACATGAVRGGWWLSLRCSAYMCVDCTLVMASLTPPSQIRSGSRHGRRRGRRRRHCGAARAA